MPTSSIPATLWRSYVPWHLHGALWLAALAAGFTPLVAQDPAVAEQTLVEQLLRDDLSVTELFPDEAPSEAQWQVAQKRVNALVERLKAGGTTAGTAVRDRRIASRGLVFLAGVAHQRLLAIPAAQRSAAAVELRAILLRLRETLTQYQIDTMPSEFSWQWDQCRLRLDIMEQECNDLLNDVPKGAVEQLHDILFWELSPEEQGTAGINATLRSEVARQFKLVEECAQKAVAAELQAAAGLRLFYGTTPEQTKQRIDEQAQSARGLKQDAEVVYLAKDKDKEDQWARVTALIKSIHAPGLPADDGMAGMFLSTWEALSSVAPRPGSTVGRVDIPALLSGGGLKSILDQSVTMPRFTVGSMEAVLPATPFSGVHERLKGRAAVIENAVMQAVKDKRTVGIEPAKGQKYTGLLVEGSEVAPSKLWSFTKGPVLTFSEVSKSPASQAFDKFYKEAFGLEYGKVIPSDAQGQKEGTLSSLKAVDASIVGPLAAQISQEEKKPWVELLAPPVTPTQAFLDEMDLLARPDPKSGTLSFTEGMNLLYRMRLYYVTVQTLPGGGDFRTPPVRAGDRALDLQNQAASRTWLNEIVSKHLRPVLLAVESKGDGQAQPDATAKKKEGALSDEADSADSPSPPAPESGKRKVPEPGGSFKP